MSKNVTNHSQVIATSYEAFNSICKKRQINDNSVIEWTNQAFIEIQSEEDLKEEECKFHFSKDRSNVLRLAFDDCDKDESYMYKGKECQIKAISDEQADQLAKFIHDNIDKHFLIHCHAGVSRSGAVAQFICEVKDIPLTEFVIMNPYASPNREVLRKLRKSWEKYSSLNGERN